MSFDIRTLGAQLVQGTGLYGAFASQVGFPTEVLNLTKEKLSYMPQAALQQVDGMTRELKSKTEEAIKTSFNDMVRAIGIEQYVTEEGLINLRQELSLVDLDFTLPVELGNLVDLMNTSPTDLYKNIEVNTEVLGEVTGLLSQMQQAIDITATKDFAEIANNTKDYIDASFAKQTSKLQKAVELKEKVLNIERLISDELVARLRDPSKEPVINSKYADKFISDLNPFSVEEPEELIESAARLAFGPPVSREGQYILSLDGLYFDSQSEEGLTPILTQITDAGNLLDKAKKWNFDFAPNLGGKGEQISSASFNEWLDSVFDINVIDDSKIMAEHYAKDGLLSNLTGQSDKRVTDMTKVIDDALKNSSTTSEAVLNNLRQGLVSELSTFQEKIKKRKKQIEIAVKAPSIFKGLEMFQPGTVPVNDFSYLQKFNLGMALSDQKKLVINTEDISDIILPVEPKFVKSSPKNPTQTLDHLFIPSVGFDAIIESQENIDDETPTTLAMEEYVSTEGLFGLFNFLNSDVVLPSSLDFNLNNCITPDATNNAQLVCKSAKEIFVDLGLGAPYFKGITENSASEKIPNALGSYTKLPDTKEFQNWTYNKTGFGFETWIYMPTLEDSEIGWKDNGVSSLYRLILANENTGIRLGTVREDDYLVTPLTNGSEYTKGMIFGFTIDKRWTRKQLPDNDFDDQKPESGNGYGLVLAPTTSFDVSSATFITAKVCETNAGWLGMYISHDKQTASGKKLSDCKNGYMQLGLSVDHKKNLITVFLDGEVLETSAVTDVFGTETNQPVRIPTFKQQNSFEYRTESVGSLAPKSLRNGPKLYPFFTPWILGGGFTDGNALGGGFMGGEYGGLISGLRGFLGSVKFYSRAIEQSDLLKNYQVQQKLFKQIKYRKPIILAIGQDNMDASYVDLASAPAEFAGPQEGISIWDPFISNGSWVTLNASIRNNTTRYTSDGSFQRIALSNGTPAKMCPMIPFMRKVRDLEQSNSSIKSDVYLIKNALKDTYMFNWTVYSNVANLSSLQQKSWTYNPLGAEYSAEFGVSASPEEAVLNRDLYPTLKQDLINALSDAKFPYEFEIRAIVLDLGINDSLAHIDVPSQDKERISNEWDESYRLLYNRILTILRDEGHIRATETPPWVILNTQSTLPDNGDPPLVTYSYPYVDNVRNGQISITNDNVNYNAYLVDSSRLSYITEDIASVSYTGIRLDAKSLVTLGGRYYEKYKEVIGYE